MNALMNSASAGNSSFEPQAHNPAALDSELTAELNLTEPNREDKANSGADPEAWRREVAARLARYRTRRKPRAPRYPSLLLPFEPYRPVEASPSALETPDDLPIDHEPASSSSHVALRNVGRHEQRGEAGFENRVESRDNPAPEPSPKVIEFPRWAAIPTAYASTLADPILERPRIVEAPEIVPPAPALGGILIDAVQPEPADRAGRVPRICSASIARRLLAACVDASILAAAMSAFGIIFFRFNPVRGPLPLLVSGGAILAILLWMVYEFGFLVYTGSTLGLWAARLKLVKFDGSPVARRTRRWRVLASFLSVFSAGLGFLWCFVDQDSLAWHDRITRTYIQPAKSSR